MEFWPGFLSEIGLPGYRPPALIFATHFIIDWIKCQYNDHWQGFLWDQFAHFVVIVVIGILNELLLNLTFPFKDWFLNPYVGALFLVALVTRPCHFFIRDFMQDFSSQKPAEEENALSNAGQYIGFFERLIVMLFVLVEAWAALGFLFAAKSILRFQNQKISEYVLLGSFLSWMLAILLTLAGIQLFEPAFWEKIRNILQ